MAIVPTSPSLLQGVVDDVVSALALVLDARRAAALILDHEGGSCRTIASWGLSGDERDRVSKWLTIGDEARPYWERLASEGRPIYLDAVRSKAIALWHGVVDVPPHLAVPLIGTDGTLLGGILLEMAAPNERDLGVASKMGRVAAVAIEQTRAAEAHAAELERNAMIFDIVREVDRRVELPEVLATICRKTVEVFGCRQTTLYFHSRRYGASLPLADYGTPPHIAERFAGERYLKGNIPHELEVSEGRTVIIRRDGNAPAEDLALLDAVEVQALVLVPLRDDEGTVRGVLNAGFTEAHDFTAEELRALELVAHYAAMAIMRARFLHRTAVSARFRAAVSALAVELNAGATRTETLDALCARGSDLFGVESAVVLLEARGRFVVAAAHGDLVAQQSLVIALDADDSPVARAFQTREVVLANDRPRRDDAPPLDRLRSLLAIPLVESEGPVGVLVLGALRPRRFRPEVVEEAPVLGALAASVIRNLELVAQLHESNERLRQLGARKDQFLANVSHDLRTPLSVIIGFAQLALEDTFGAPTAELRETLQRMLASAHQQLALVQDLLDASRLEINGLSVKPTPVPLGTIFGDMEVVATSLVRKKPVSVAVEAVSPDVWVQADPDRLRQILTNLLANSAKFTDEGTIALRADVRSDLVRIDVCDSGIGIPADQLEVIFEPFRQVEGERAQLGTGLGLAIARKLATLMGGTLTAAGNAGHGSTFSLVLPAAQVPARTAAA